MKSFRITPEINQVTLAENENQLSPQSESTNQIQSSHTTAIIRKATLSDIGQIYHLYKVVAIVNQGNLTQESDEITLKCVNNTVRKGLQRGLILVIKKDKNIIGYLKAFTSEFRTLAHVLTNTKMIVHPEWQGREYGSNLINAYLEKIKANMPHILRFELLPHQSNQRAIRFYQRHGFVQESLAEQKIRNVNGNFEPEVILVWFNPNFSKDALRKYHAFQRTLI
jgi:ribosomal protein S18 acetylase RimI-like enzyme